MPKQSKSTTKPTEVAETTPAVQKKETKPRAPKQSASVAPPTQPVVESVAPPVHSETAVATTSSSDEVAELVSLSTEFLAKLNQASTLFATLKTEFRTLEKRWSKELKTAQKSQSKSKRKSGNRKPSGFVKPTKISDELATFLGKEKGSEMARTDVTREINQYIRDHKLQDKDNGRKIIPDNKLQSLLKLKKTDELTYFNLQKYMSPHFFKTEKPATTA